MNLLSLLWFVVGLGLLVGGAELLVRGASRLAMAFGISPLVVGLTVVAYGTSSPEIAVSVFSTLSGQADIAVGNVVGSNIFNILFILGLSAVILPLSVSTQLVRLEVPLMIGISILLLVVALDGTVSRLDGILLLAIALVYTIALVRQSRQPGPTGTYPPNQARTHPIAAVCAMVAGLALLVFGSRWLVQSAVAMARAFGVSELIIGLTIVAAGTSLPEVATSVIASIRRERDIAVGNVVGSNIINILGVVGISALVAPRLIPVHPATLAFDIPVMIAAAIACLPVFVTNNQIARWEGGLFLGYYLAYTLYLLMDATQHDALPMFNTVMLSYVIPLTAVTLLVLALGARRPEAPT